MTLLRDSWLVAVGVIWAFLTVWLHSVAPFSADWVMAVFASIMVVCVAALVVMFIDWGLFALAKRYMERARQGK